MHIHDMHIHEMHIHEMHIHDMHNQDLYNFVCSRYVYLIYEYLNPIYPIRSIYVYLSHVSLTNTSFWLYVSIYIRDHF